MLLLRIRFCSDIRGQSRYFLLLGLCNLLDISRPTSYGLLVAISRRVSYSVALESDSESLRVLAVPVTNCPFK